MKSIILAVAVATFALAGSSSVPNQHPKQLVAEGVRPCPVPLIQVADGISYILKRPLVA